MIKLAHVLALTAAAALLGGCQTNRDRLFYDGHSFRTQVRAVNDAGDVFAVTIRDATQSLAGARLAGRHAATSYCVGRYGNSDIAWDVGPQTPPQRLTIRDGSIVFRGTCPQ